MGQRTIAEKVSCTGIGLHSGLPAQLNLLPARADTGIVFVRTDGGRPVEIPARPQSVRSTELATTLAAGGARVGTVEHLLAALYGLGVDNLRAEIEGPELPVMDGSSAPFAYLIRSAGLFAQRTPRAVLRVRRAVTVREGGARARVEPARDFGVHYRVEIAHPAIGRQEFRLDAPDASGFEREVAGARSFGFLRDVERMRARGFALGGSLENTVVLDDAGVVNPEGLRWPDEFVRHKILDLLGDLALLGLPLRGRVLVERGGHALHQKLVRALLADPDAWRIEPGLPEG